MYRQNTLSTLAGVLHVAALSIYLVLPNSISAQSPPQGPPAATPNAHTVTVDALTSVLTGIVNPQVAAENSALAHDPNFRAVITATVQPFTPFMTQTINTDKPNQFLADVPYEITYRISDISVKVSGTFVPYPAGATIAQFLDLRATCQGWFTLKGSLTYSAAVTPATLEGDQTFPNTAVATLLQQVIPTYLNNVVAPKIGTFPAGASSVSNGASCRTLGTSPSPIIFIANSDGQAPNSINYDPGALFPPILTGQNSVTVSVTKIRRLVLHGLGGNPEYAAIETPALDFFAGFSEAHIQLPPMSEGQTVVPTQGNVVTTLIPLQSGLLVLLGDLTYGDIPNEDSAFVSFGVNSDFGAGTQTFQISKHWIQGFLGGKPIMASGPAYEITVQIIAPPTQTIHR